MKKIVLIIFKTPRFKTTQNRDYFTIILTKQDNVLMKVNKNTSASKIDLGKDTALNYSIDGVNG